MDDDLLRNILQDSEVKDEFAAIKGNPNALTNAVKCGPLHMELSLQAHDAEHGSKSPRPVCGFAWKGPQNMGCFASTPL